MSQFVQMSQKLAFGLVRIFGTSTNRGLPWKNLHKNFRSRFLGEFLYLWTGKEKILGQKVNVKFFTVGPYVPLALVRQTILKTRVLAKYIWNINKRPNPQKINSLKDYMVDSQFLMSFDFFGFFCIFYDFLKKETHFCKKNKKIGCQLRQATANFVVAFREFSNKLWHFFYVGKFTK